MNIASVTLGRHFWTYFTASFAVVILAIAASVYALPSSARSVDTGFYAAASAMLPVLLLALLVRIGRVGQGLLQMHRELRRDKRIEGELDKLKLSIETTLTEAVDKGDETTARQSEDQLRRVGLLAETTTFTNTDLGREATKATEVVFAALLVALALAFAGMVAALIPLATDHSTWLTLSFTSIGLLWLICSLVALEIVSFQSSLVTSQFGFD